MEQRQQRTIWQVKNEGSFASVNVSLPPKASFHCESDAVVSMSHEIDVRGAMSGGILSSIARAFLTRESFFTTQVDNISLYKLGDVLIAPSDPGGIAIHELAPGRDIILVSGAYLAGDETAKVTTSMNSPFSSFGNFSGTGLFLLKASGHGKLAISAYGSMHKFVLAEGETRKVDNGHLVAWSASMKARMVLASDKSGIFGSMTSGEGLHCEFMGPGIVYIQSHKPNLAPNGTGGTITKNGGARMRGSGSAFTSLVIFSIIILLLFGFTFAVVLYYKMFTSHDSENYGYNDRRYNDDSNSNDGYNTHSYQRNEF